MQIIPASKQQIEQMRSLPGYSFRVFDELFQDEYHGNAARFLKYGRNLLFQYPELTEDRIMLARSWLNKRSVSLFVDRDYYELSLQDGNGSHHLTSWQFIDGLTGYTVTDLEYLMHRYLSARPVSTRYNASQTKPLLLHR